MTKQAREKRIAELNDKFRKGLASGRVHMTAGVNAKGSDFVVEALIKVIALSFYDSWERAKARDEDFRGLY